MTYTTKAGDMWDAIAHQAYGNSTYASKLMYANPEHADYFILPAGLVLTVPELQKTDLDSSFAPPWRR